MRTLTALALAAALLAIPAALAGTPESPEVSDAAGDQAVQAGPLVVAGVNDDPFGDVDVVRAWVGPESGDAFRITVETTGAPAAGTLLNVSFSIERGPTSLYGSTATDTPYAIQVTGTTVDGDVDGVAVSADGNRTTLTVRRAAVGAMGGDLLSNLVVAASRSDTGDLPVAQDDQSATDRAPDQGAGSPYTFFRPPVQAGVLLTPEGASFVRVEDGSASARLAFEVQNTGTDLDSFELSASAVGATATLNATRVDLAPGESAAAEALVDLEGAEAGEIPVTLTAKSSRGATADLDFTVLFAPPAAQGPQERVPTPEGLDFLTPWAEALGLDEALDEYAELFLLALLVLAAIVLLFLLLMLTRRPWLRVRVRPRRVRAAPGESAEARLEVSNPKRKERHAKARLRGEDGGWRAGVLLRQGAEALPPLTRAADELDLVLPGRRDPAHALEGTLRVRVPPDARPRERHDVRLDVVPLDAGGGERPAHAAHARIRVQAAPRRSPVETGDVRLDPVVHVPDRPAPGQEVESRVTLHNAGDRPRRMRIVLSVDGTPEAETVAELPPRSDETVRLRWEAGAGPNQVRVQVFSA